MVVIYKLFAEMSALPVSDGSYDNSVCVVPL